jgi:NADH-quinone oxidoreductase subunit E
VISPRVEKEIDALQARLPRPQAAMLPALHLIQDELGHVPVPAREWLAAKLQVSPAAVEAVLSFYTLLRREPQGKHILHVCSTLPCALRGCERVYERLRELLGIASGETTPDGRFTLHRAECLGACDRAPVVQVNGEFHDHVAEIDPDSGRVSLERLERLVASLREESLK